MFELRLARESELEEIYSLYKEMFGSPYSTWSERYPTMDILRQDLEADSLYAFTENKKIIGAVVIVPENELECLDLGQLNDGTQREAGRLIIKKSRQGQGLVRVIFEFVEGICRAQGAGALQFLVAKINTPARKAYEKLGYQDLGEANLYENKYLLMEKRFR